MDRWKTYSKKSYYCKAQMKASSMKLVVLGFLLIIIIACVHKHMQV